MSRASLIVILDIAIVGLIWALSAIAEGGFIRWLRRRSTTWFRSYRGRLTLALPPKSVTVVALEVGG